MVGLIALLLGSCSSERGYTVYPLSRYSVMTLGYKIVEFKGNFVDVIVVGVVVGVVCGVLTIVLLLAHGMMGMGVLLSEFVFNVGMNLVGAIVGGGYALTK